MATPVTPTTIVDNTAVEPPARPAIAELENGRLFQWNGRFFRKVQAPTPVSTSAVALREFVASGAAAPNGDEVGTTLPGNIVVDQLVALELVFRNLPAEA